MAGETCIANIGSAGRRKRMTFGVIALALAVGVAATLVVLDVERLWRVSVGVLLFLGGTGVFQARAKT